MVKDTLCEICGKYKATETHHLIFGNSFRSLCDSDDICLNVCRECHKSIHMNGTAEKLSKMLGQAMWESKFLEYNDASTEVAREAFRRRYGRSWL